MADRTALVRTLYEAWNDRKFDELADHMAPKGVITIVGTGETFVGRDGSRAYSRLWADGFPDATVTVDRIIASGDDVVVEFTGRGTHTGTLATAMGEVPATGRSLTLQLCEVLTFDGDQVTAQRSYFDTGSIMAQLGLVPEQAAAAETP